MRRRVISGIMAISIFTGSSYTALATPTTEVVDDVREQYDIVSGRIKELEIKIDDISNKMEPIFFKVEENKEKIKEIEKKINKTSGDIDESKKQMDEKQKILDSRVRESYKSGAKTNFIIMLLSSKTLGDFLRNVNTIAKVISLDKAFIENLNNNKENLNKKVASLNDKKENIVKINEENKLQLKDLESMKEDQEVWLKELSNQRDNISDKLTDLERPLIEEAVQKARSSNSTIEELRQAINELSELKEVVISSKVEKEIGSAIDEANVNIKKIEEAQNFQFDVDNLGSQLTSLSGNASALISYAYKFIGKRYILGATGPDAFDCSSFTQYIFRKFGYGLTRTTYTQVNQGTYIPRDQLVPGDLVFTEGPAAAPGHVGIYVGDGKMVHAANSRKGVIVGPIYNYSTARRIL